MGLVLRGCLALLRGADPAQCSPHPLAIHFAGWCCGDKRHMDLSFTAFEKLADRSLGAIAVRWRRVTCPPGTPTHPNCDHLASCFPGGKAPAGGGGGHWGWDEANKKSVWVPDSGGKSGTSSSSSGGGGGGGRWGWDNASKKSVWVPDASSGGGSGNGGTSTGFGGSDGGSGSGAQPGGLARMPAPQARTWPDFGNWGGWGLGGNRRLHASAEL